MPSDASLTALADLLLDLARNELDGDRQDEPDVAVVIGET